MSADYEVGYGKPPQHTRFRKGQSGNTRGRRGFNENSLFRSEKRVRGSNFIVGHRVNQTARFIPRPDCTFPTSGIANVDDARIAHATGILDDSVQALDTVRDVGETALLMATVDKLERCPTHEIQDELRDDA